MPARLLETSSIACCGTHTLRIAALPAGRSVLRRRRDSGPFVMIASVVFMRINSSREAAPNFFKTDGGIIRAAPLKDYGSSGGDDRRNKKHCTDDHVQSSSEKVHR